MSFWKWLFGSWNAPPPPYTREIKVAERYYTVQKGDTLSKIAVEMYGKGHSKDYIKIFEANKPLLKDPDKIFPGQVLRIP